MVSLLLCLCGDFLAYFVDCGDLCFPGTFLKGFDNSPVGRRLIKLLYYFYITQLIFILEKFS